MINQAIILFLICFCLAVIIACIVMKKDADLAIQETEDLYN